MYTFLAHSIREKSRVRYGFKDSWKKLSKLIYSLIHDLQV